MALSLGSVPVSATIVERNRFVRALRVRGGDLRVSDDGQGRRDPQGPGPCRQEGRRPRLLHRQLRVQGDLDRRRRSLVHAVGERGRQGRQGRVARRDRSTDSRPSSPVRPRSSPTRPVASSRGIAGTSSFDLRHRPRGRELLRVPGRPALRAARGVRDRPVQARRSRSPATTRRGIRRSDPSARRPPRWASAEYLPPSYHATGAGSPLLIFLHGYGETGDGTPEAHPEPAVRRHPEVHRRRRLGDGPAVRGPLAPARRGGARVPVRARPCNGSCNMFLQHDRGTMSSPPSARRLTRYTPSSATPSRTTTSILRGST